MKKTLFAVVSAALLLTVVSCKSTKTDSGDSPTTYGGGSTSTTSSWVSLTADTAKQNYGKFYTSEELGKCSVLEADFRKESGNEGSGFGLVFGYSEPKEGVLSNYIRFEINALGEYAIYSWNGSKFADILDPSAVNTAYLVESSSIKKGLGTTNKLRIEVDSKGTYSCSINGTKVASGIQPMKDATYGVMTFFSVGRADEENFPDSPVKVAYRVTSSLDKQ